MRSVVDIPTPDEWKLIGGNRIAVFRDEKTIRIAEFFNLYDEVALPAEANAALAVLAVKELRTADSRTPADTNSEGRNE